MQSSFTKKPSNSLNDSPSSLHQYSYSQPIGPMPSIPLANLRPFQRLFHHLSILTRDAASTDRTIAHLVMIAVIILAIGLSQLELSWGTIQTIRPLQQIAGSEVDTATQIRPLTPSTELNNSQNGVLIRAAVPRTIIPDRATIEQPSRGNEITSYVVQSGDTISGIATKFGLSPDTLVWSNPNLEENPDLLSVGQEVTILPVDGIYHQVGQGDTIAGIAGTFKADPQAIIDHPLNQLEADTPTIQVGDWVLVPGGSKPFVPRTVTAYSGPAPADASLGSGIFGWPASGDISQGFFNYHPGLDIAAWVGAPVLAADAGYVIVAGWDNLYGYHVVIDHGNEFQTLYAHLNSYYVEPGTNISKGQQIGEMGSTGNSTGPHLHFEIRQGTIQRNPYGFLP